MNRAAPISVSFALGLHGGLQSLNAAVIGWWPGSINHPIRLLRVVYLAKRDARFGESCLFYIRLHDNRNSEILSFLCVRQFCRAPPLFENCQQGGCTFNIIRQIVLWLILRCLQ